MYACKWGFWETVNVEKAQKRREPVHTGTILLLLLSFVLPGQQTEELRKVTFLIISVPEPERSICLCQHCHYEAQNITKICPVV